MLNSWSRKSEVQGTCGSVRSHATLGDQLLSTRCFQGLFAGKGLL